MAKVADVGLIQSQQSVSNLVGAMTYDFDEFTLPLGAVDFSVSAQTTLFTNVDLGVNLILRSPDTDAVLSLKFITPLMETDATNNPAIPYVSSEFPVTFSNTMQFNDLYLTNDHTAGFTLQVFMSGAGVDNAL